MHTKYNTTTVESNLTTNKAREIGKKYCQTEGSKHYKGKGLEPIDVLLTNSMAEDFCLGNIIKYAIRFKDKRNPDDLKKIADYAHILCGIELFKKEQSVNY